MCARSQVFPSPPHAKVAVSDAPNATAAVEKGDHARQADIVLSQLWRVKGIQSGRCPGLIQVLPDAVALRARGWHQRFYQWSVIAFTLVKPSPALALLTMELPMDLSQQQWAVPRLLFLSVAILLFTCPVSAEPGPPPTLPRGKSILVNRLAYGRVLLTTTASAIRSLLAIVRSTAPVQGAATRRSSSLIAVLSLPKLP